MPWSYSKLKDYEACPHRLTIAASKPTLPSPPESIQAGIGTHKAIEAFLKGEATQLPETHQNAQIATLRAKLSLSEHALSVDTHWKPSNWSNAWGRAVLDAFHTDPHPTVVDFKTGKPYPIAHADQAQVYALIVSAHYPDQPITVEFLYLTTNAPNHTIHYTPDQITRIIKPRLEARIHRMETDTVLQPRPNKHVCKYCKYKTICDYAPDESQ